MSRQVLNNVDQMREETRWTLEILGAWIGGSKRRQESFMNRSFVILALDEGKGNGQQLFVGEEPTSPGV